MESLVDSLQPEFGCVLMLQARPTGISLGGQTFPSVREYLAPRRSTSMLGAPLSRTAMIGGGIVPSSAPNMHRLMRALYKNALDSNVITN